MSTDDIKRIHFYERQFLGVDDFKEEQNYHIEMRRRHMIAHHLWGIVAGLKITQDADSKIWSVEPGMAVDAFGREIFVFDPEPLNVESVAGQLAGAPKPAHLKIWIAYKIEKANRPSANYRSCEAGEQFTRVRETFRLIYQDDPVFHFQNDVAPAGQNADNRQTWPRAYQNLQDDPAQARWPIYLGTLRWDTDPDHPSQNIISAVSPVDPIDNQRRRYIGVVAGELEAPTDKLLVRARGSQTPLPDGHAGVQAKVEGTLEVMRQVTAEDDLNVLGSVGIGIGQKSPATRLQISGGKDASLDADAGYLLIGTTGGKNLVLDDNEIMARDDGQISALHLQADGGDVVVHHNKPATKVVVKDSGEVGIGTTQPDNPLTIAGSGGTYLNVKANNGAHEVLLGADGSGGIVSTITNHDLQLRAGSNSTKMTVKANGQIGIGTSQPNRELTIAGSGGTYLNVKDDNGAREVLLGADGAGGIVSTMTNHDLQLRAGVNSTKLIIKASGDVGIGTTAPVVRFQVLDNRSGNALIPDHVAFVENSSSDSNADVLALKVGHSAPATSNNFITFFGGDDAVGSIQGNGSLSGGVALNSTGADYAEWLPRLEAGETFEAGDIVGVCGGKISKATEAAHHIMAIASHPLVLGNMPPKETEHLYERVAFLGQVPVRVRGRVEEGDFIVPSGLNDGTGIAVSPRRAHASQLAQALGRAWQSSADEGVHLVNTVVGLPAANADAGVLAALFAQQEEIKELRAEIENLKALKQLV